jgi:hypothetical protein
VGEQERHGKWVFRNQRWHFLSGEGALFEREPMEVGRDALLSLVDSGELLRQFSGLAEVAHLPLLFFPLQERRHRKGGGPATEDELGLAHEVLPGYYDRSHPGLQAFWNRCRADLAAVARRAIRSRAAAMSEGVCGEGTCRAFPLCFEHSGRTLAYGVVATMAAGREQVPGPAALSRALGCGEDAAGTAAQVLAAQLPAAAAMPAWMELLAMLVRAHVARVQEAYACRTELAAEQARCRHYILRAEWLEREMFSEAAGTDRADAGDRLLPREMETLSEIPFLGITVEDADFNVRYVNGTMRRMFGDLAHRRCYEYFKARSSPCPEEECPIVQLWDRGRESFRYWSLDPRSGRHFEIMSVPVVGRSGDRLILEVGFEITQAVREFEVRDQEIEALRGRNRQLSALISRCARLTSDAARRCMALVPDGQEDGVLAGAEAVAVRNRGLASVLDGVAYIASAVWEVMPPALVDLEAVVRAVAARLAAKRPGAGVVLRSLVLPTVETDPRAMERLLEALVKVLAAGSQAAPLCVEVSQTRSGDSGSLTPGDRFHVLRIALHGPEAAGPEDLRVWQPETITGSESFLLTVAGLLAGRLGGALLVGEGGAGRSYYVSIPVTPPPDQL